MSQIGTLKRSFDDNDSVEFVVCRICGDHRRVINSQHLSKHDTDRETYMEEFDLSPDELTAKDFRIIQSSRRGYYPNGKSEWIAAIRKLYESDGNVHAGYLQDKYAHLYEQGVWIFGDWDKALCAAGFDPDTMRERSLWDEEKIIDTVRSMHKKQLPLYAAYVMDNHHKLFSAALRQFGSWPKALVAASVSKKPRAKRLYRGRASLLNALSDGLGQHTVEDVPQTLKLEAAHYFGSLEKAMAVLKKQGDRLPGWNKREVMTVLSRMHHSKQSLAYATVRREHMALVSAAEAHFGSWGKALYAAWHRPQYVLCPSQVAQIESTGGADMTIDDDTLKQLLRINDELMQLCKFLNEKRDVETSSRLIPLVDDLTHILIIVEMTRFQLQQFTVIIKELAQWFGLEIARIAVDECLPQRES